MKAITAVIPPARLERVWDAFRRRLDFTGLTVSKTQLRYNPGQMKDDGVSDLLDHAERVRIDIVAPDEQVEQLLKILHEECHTGRLGDGVVWVTPVDSFQLLREPL